MDFTTRYQRPSTIDTHTGLLLVFLAAHAAPQPQPTPQLFSGAIAEPVLFRSLLLGLRQTVDARFYRPDLWRLLDPVITAGNRLLRMECFSSCASVYARADLTENVFADGEFQRDGTTNVDLNSAFVEQLAALRPGKTAHFEMGEASVRLETYRGAAVEHKVTLPERWLKGFLQVQAVQRRMEAAFELDRLSARQFVTDLPLSGNNTLYIIPKRPRPLLLFRAPAEEHLVVAGAQRLRLLRSLLPHLEGLRVYRSPDTGATVWVADLKQAQFTLALSSAISHGFSGDGDALRQLRTATVDEADLVFARAAAQSLNHFTLPELVAHQDIDPPQAADLADRLAMQGLLGYDRDRDRYFYRRLPFADALARAPQRLHNAGTLLDSAAVSLDHCERNEHGLSARGRVRGAKGVYNVALQVDSAGYLREGQCGCDWINRNGLQRGPCKHLLALRFAAEHAP